MGRPPNGYDRRFRPQQLLSWYLGGLNYQFEHHLFPKVSHLHYPALAKIVEEVARDHGLRYRSSSSFSSSIAAHYRHLRALGAAPKALRLLTPIAV